MSKDLDSFQDQVMQAIVQQFFNPIVITDQFGNQRSQEATAMIVARKLLEQAGVIDKIIAALDLDKMAEDAAGLVFAKLTAKPDFYNKVNYDEKMLQDAVREKLATKLADDMYASKQSATDGQTDNEREQ